MRIVAGEFRGRTIDAPRGEGTRPTTDRVREALMSSLYSLRGGFEGAVVLDAFAGTGALGLEALSRGARCATFYENDPAALKVLSRNVQACCKDKERAVVVGRDFLKSTPRGMGSSFDLVFLDPPYAFNAQEVLTAVVALIDVGLIAKDAIIVYEHAKKDGSEVVHALEDAGMELVAERKYGKTSVAVAWATGEGDNDSDAENSQED